jgi:malonyl-CoA O-methyltransferase
MTKKPANKRQHYKKVGVVEGYDIWAPTYDEEHNPLIALEQSITLDLIGDVHGLRVLDVGCGTGRYCELLTKKGATVVGIDPSKKMLERAKTKITPNCKFELRLGKIEDAEFPDDQFNLVVYALTVGHAPHLEPVIRKISRILKHNGSFILSDMHPYWFVSGFDYVEFSDRNRKRHRIPEYPHLVDEYWSLFKKFKLRLEDIEEPRINDKLLERFPNLARHKGKPLALILKSRKE